MPGSIQPMLAKSGPLPKGGDWAYEIKWDGVRAIGYVDGGRLRLESRNSKNITPRYPELRPLGRALGTHEAILDGEIVAFGDDGRPSFERLQGRMHLTSEAQVRRLSQSRPVAYVIFDLLYLDGHSLLELPYLERRERLAELELNGATWQVPAYHRGDGAALLEASRAQRLEGIVAKRVDSQYTPGRRSGGWVKVKNVRRTDVVIGGWLKGDGGRAGRLGALAMGAYEDGELRFVGKVGTGFTDAELKRLQGLLEPLERPESPFEGTQPPKLTRFVEPLLVASVEYTDITRIGTIRHPSYKGLRDDVDPREVAIDRADVG
jgi:bifunctional non-homologous end joining protein LigD